MSMGKLGVRHVQAVLLAGALIVTNMYLGNLGMAVVVITQEENRRRLQRDSFLNFGQESKVSMITGSFFYSQMVFCIIGGYLCTKVNNKIIMLIASSVGFSISYLTPTLIYIFQWKALFFVRLAQGAAQGLVKPVVYNLATRWLPTDEMLLLGPAILCGLPTGLCFMLMMGGYLGAGQGGWPSIFYFSANCGLIWSIAFYGLGFTSPNNCFYISDLEKDYINKNVPPSVIKPYRHNIPWKKIFTNIPLWSLLICQFANNWSLNVFVKIWPVFLQQKLGYGLHQTGVICGTPFLLVSINAYITTVLFHYLWRSGKLNHIAVRHLCNAIAHFGTAYCFMICSSSQNSHLTITSHHIALFLCSFQLFGWYMSFYDLSPTYIGLTTGLCNGIAHLGSIIGPYVTVEMCNNYENDDNDEWMKDPLFIGWRKAYDYMSVNFFVAGTAFMFLAEFKKQDFDKNEEKIVAKSNKPV